MKNKTHLIGVYGSLRQGMYNHRLLDNDGAEFIKHYTYTLPYKMIAYSSFPALIPEKDEKTNNVDFEVYAVDDNTYRMVERLEGYPSFYDKDTFSDPNLEQPIEFYYIHDEDGRLAKQHEKMTSIKDWCAYYKTHFQTR